MTNGELKFCKVKASVGRLVNNLLGWIDATPGVADVIKAQDVLEAYTSQRKTLEGKLAAFQLDTQATAAQDKTNASAAALKAIESGTGFVARLRNGLQALGVATPAEEQAIEDAHEYIECKLTEVKALEANATDDLNEAQTIADHQSCVRAAAMVSVMLNELVPLIELAQPDAELRHACAGLKLKFPHLVLRDAEVHTLVHDYLGHELGHSLRNVTLRHRPGMPKTFRDVNIAAFEAHGLRLYQEETQ